MSIAKKTINEEALLKEVETELESVEGLTDEQLEIEAKKVLTREKTSYAMPRNPANREATRAREKFKRTRLKEIMAQADKLGLKIGEDGTVKGGKEDE